MNENNVKTTEGGQENDKALLQRLCDNGFAGNVEETALVLGRTTEEIEGILQGDEVLDEDLAMKIRGIAEERDIEIE